MRISDWSSDVCSSDLDGQIYLPRGPVIGGENAFGTQGRAKARRSVGEDEFARIGILPQEVVARDDIFLVRQVLAVEADRRSEERRVGKECVSTCIPRWSRDH